MFMHRYVYNIVNQCRNIKRIKFSSSNLRFYCINSNKDDSSQIISILNVKRIIKASGFDMDDGFTSIKTTCPACDVINNENKIYINKITGNFICTTCQHTGKWSSIEKLFASTKSSRTNKEIDKYKDIFIKSKSNKEILNVPDYLKSLKNMPDKDIVNILDNMKVYDISSTIFQNLDAKYDEIFKKLYFPLIDVDNRTVGYKILYYDQQSEKIVEETVPKVNSYGLITSKSNVNTLKRDCQTAILVLNILDLLILASNKINYTIVCLPHNSQSLPQQCLPQLESFNKLILWFSCDAAGWDTARNFAKKLDEKRCLFVRPTDAHPAPYEAVQHGFDLKTIIGKAQPILHKAITTFSALRQDVLSDLQNIDKVQGVKWKRFPSLNKFLKGHRKGELTVLTGPTGCGKTTFMSEYSLDLAMQGVTTLWGSFEIRNTRLASTLLRQLAGRPLDENLVEFDYWADEFERFPIYFMTFHGQQSIKVVMDAIDHAQYVHDIQHVIIDNVQFMMGIGDEPKNNDRFWKQDVLIAAFRTFATKKNCHVTLVIHPRKERDADDLTTSSIFGGAKASQEADNVLIIQDKRLTSIRGKKYLQVAKNRYSGDLGIMPLEFDKSGLSYAQRKKKTEDKGGGIDSVENVKE